MATTAIEVTTEGKPAGIPAARVVFTEGGKGGVGKTAVATILADWYQSQGFSPALIDMDTENKMRGSLSHFYPARKSNIQTERGLDEFLHVLDEGSPLILADMGAGAGQVAQQWFNSMYDTAAANGIVFTAVGIVTPDPASVASVLSWAAFLQKRVSYVVVRNAVNNPADFSYWETDPQAADFRKVMKPREISMEYRVSEIEHETRQHGVTLRAVATREASVPTLKQTATVWRAQAYRRNVFAEFDKIKDVLL
jgi:hypothetical protein